MNTRVQGRWCLVGGSSCLLFRMSNGNMAPTSRSQHRHQVLVCATFKTLSAPSAPALAHVCSRFSCMSFPHQQQAGWTQMHVLFLIFLLYMFHNSAASIVKLLWNRQLLVRPVCKVHCLQRPAFCHIARCATRKVFSGFRLGHLSQGNATGWEGSATEPHEHTVGAALASLLPLQPDSQLSSSRRHSSSRSSSRSAIASRQSRNGRRVRA